MLEVGLADRFPFMVRDFDPIGVNIDGKRSFRDRPAGDQDPHRLIGRVGAVTGGRYPGFDVDRQAGVVSVETGKMQRDTLESGIEFPFEIGVLGLIPPDRVVASAGSGNLAPAYRMDSPSGFLEFVALEPRNQRVLDVLEFVHEKPLRL